MNKEILKLTTYAKNSRLKVSLICLISFLISFFYVFSKPIINSYTAETLYEVGSLNHSFIDGVNTLNALALAHDYPNISIEKAFDHSHYLLISSTSDNIENASNNLKNFVNLILKRHNLMIDKRTKEISESINVLNQQLEIKQNSGLLLKLLEQKELLNSLKKSAILKNYEVKKQTNNPNRVLGIAIGLIIGLMISLILLLFQYTFYYDRKI